MNLRERSALERTAVWLEELLAVCKRPGEVYAQNNDLVADVTRKAKALKTVLQKLRDFLDGKETK